MSGQMCWLESMNSNGEKSLHLRLEPHHPWRSYKNFPAYSAPENSISTGAKGWSTCQKLLREGWTLLPSN